MSAFNMYRQKIDFSVNSRFSKIQSQDQEKAATIE